VFENDIAIEATKRIFDLIGDDEQVAIGKFDSVAEFVQRLKPKGAIDRTSLFAKLDVITDDGGTNFEPSLSILKDSGTGVFSVLKDGGMANTASKVGRPTV
jgi:hypothetical protein